MAKVEPPYSTRQLNKFELWLISAKGKSTINRFYSWGAAFVILGALFKFLDWPYANIILFISMMTEVLVFFVSGFEPQTENIEQYPPVEYKKEISEHLITKNPEFQINEDLHKRYYEEIESLTERVAELKKEHELMTKHLAELNSLYSRMLAAMHDGTQEQE